MIGDTPRVENRFDVTRRPSTSSGVPMPDRFLLIEP
jgi:hypothetical protein